MILCLSRYRNQTGVEIRAVDFGGLGGIDALDPGLPSLTPLYSGLTKAFKDEGYEERKDLFGAPYDFRLAGDGLKQVLVTSVIQTFNVPSLGIPQCFQMPSRAARNTQIV